VLLFALSFFKRCPELLTAQLSLISLTNAGGTVEMA